MGKTAILDGFLQSDLDCKGFNLINQGNGGGGGGGGGGPIGFPPRANQFLVGYDSVSRQFSAARPLLSNLTDWPNPHIQFEQFLTTHDGVTYDWGQPDVNNLVNWPNPHLQGGKFLTTDGVGYSWATQQAVAPSDGFINVKSAPYNAVGDGVTDDFLAIQSAVNGAQTGQTVYFPKGQYLISRVINVPAGSTLLGDNPFQCVLTLKKGTSGGCMLCAGAVQITRLGFNGNGNLYAQGDPTNVSGVVLYNGNAISLFQCVVVNTTGAGIIASGCFGVTIKDCYVINCGGYGIEVYYAGKTLLSGNQIYNTVLSGIWVVNSGHSSIVNNQIYSCGVYGYGIGLFDSDNTVVSGNLIEQCAIGMILSTSFTRAISVNTNVSYGYVVTGNNIIRNYYGGMMIALAHGTLVTGNVITDNGQGGTDNATYTVEAGIVVDGANLGSGYAVGDVLTLVGGSGTAAKVLVTRVSGGQIQTDGLFVLSAGAYTTFPANPVVTTCARSGPTGAKVILTGCNIASGGSGYLFGQILRANVGTFNNPVRVQVNRVDANGSVTQIAFLDGGGYTGSLPGLLTFANDALSPEFPDTPPSPTAGPIGGDQPEIGSGFSLTPSWGRRYSQTGKFGGNQSFGLSTYGAAYFSVVSGNAIDWTRTGTGILVVDEPSGNYHNREDYMCVTGNSLIDNLHSIKGWTRGSALDALFAFNGLWANNLVYPAGT